MNEPEPLTCMFVIVSDVCHLPASQFENIWLRTRNQNADRRLADMPAGAQGWPDADIYARSTLCGQLCVGAEPGIRCARRATDGPERRSLQRGRHCC
ncbi:hypothetical protein ABZ851_14790 [Streptomyces sp. NPDC047049]|uniref:hypothetical protein n=1 Tax=Streptomyces sp. NPDC047049 TaxID=3156688 RepID=UPI0033E308EE